MTDYVRFKDCFLAGYKVTPVSQSNITDTEEDSKINIRLTREDVDYNDFFNRCLVSVNGFYHRLDTDGTNGILVLDAVKSLNISRQNQLGIISFKDVGDIQTYSFTDAMMTSYLDNSPEVGNIRLNLPFDTENKTVIFCIGGYLRFIDDTFISRTNINSFKLNFNNISLLDIYYESKKYLDLTSLPLEHSIFNEEQVSLSQLISAENLKAYLKLSQSFIIVVDTPNITLTKKHVKKTGLPGMYIGYEEPDCPLVTGLGRHTEYWARKEDGQYAINIYDNVVDNRLYDTVIRQSLTSTDSSRRPDYPGEYSDSYLLKISKV